MGDLTTGHGRARGVGVGQVGFEELVGLVDFDGVAADEPDVLGDVVVEVAGELFGDLAACFQAQSRCVSTCSAAAARSSRRRLSGESSRQSSRAEGALAKGLRRWENSASRSTTCSNVS